MNTPDTIQDMNLDQLLELARERFPVHFEPVAALDARLDILQITDMPAYVDKLAATARDGQLELPFWAKIWPASMISSFFLQRLPVREGETILELGGGVGVAGLFAARAGHRVMITDIHPDALLFTRINILKNGLQDLAEARYVDFTSSRLDQRFSRILGCEILYQEEVYRPLIKFLDRHLSRHPGSEIILAKDYRRKARKFFKLAQDAYQWDEKVIGFKSSEEGEEEERHLCAIYRFAPLRPATQAPHEQPQG